MSRKQTNIITLHLGNGCSAAPICAGRSTSMGMTPLEGLVMGNPLRRHRSCDCEHHCNERRIISERSGDGPQYSVWIARYLEAGKRYARFARELISRGDPRVRLAIEVFCYRARKYIGAFLACMGGADAVVFTGGIGENSVDILARICEGFAWAGLRVDENRNKEMRGVEGQISSDDSRLYAFVIPTDEELMIARDTVRCILDNADSTNGELA